MSHIVQVISVDQRQGQMLGRSSWSVNVYCMRTGSCEDKQNYLQNAESIVESVTVHVEQLTEYLICIMTFQRLYYLCKNYA